MVQSLQEITQNVRARVGLLKPGYYWIRFPGYAPLHVAEINENGLVYTTGVSGSSRLSEVVIVAGPLQAPEETKGPLPNAPSGEELSLRIWLDDEFRKINARLDRAGIR